MESMLTLRIVYPNSAVDAEVISDFPSAAIAIPSSSVGPEVTY
jgi:hypothetical protein